MGRPRQFEESNLLDAAEHLFWSNGYGKTSIEGVAAAAGLGNGSIYAAYGSKMALFVKVFTRYCDAKAIFVEEVFRSAEGSGRAVVRTYFETVIADCASQPDRRGCLMLNGIVELGHRVEAVRVIGAQSIAQMEASVAARLRRNPSVAVEAMSVANMTSLSSLVILTSQGLIQLSRLGAEVHQLHELADLACAAMFPPCRTSV